MNTSFSVDQFPTQANIGASESIFKRRFSTPARDAGRHEKNPAARDRVEVYSKSAVVPRRQKSTAPRRRRHVRQLLILERQRNGRTDALTRLGASILQGVFGQHPSQVEGILDRAVARGSSTFQGPRSLRQPFFDGHPLPAAGCARCADIKSFGPTRKTKAVAGRRLTCVASSAAHPMLAERATAICKQLEPALDVTRRRRDSHRRTTSVSGAKAIRLKSILRRWKDVEPFSFVRHFFLLRNFLRFGNSGLSL